MKLKERERSKLFNWFKSLKQLIFSRRVKLFLIILIGISIFFLGILFGLVTSGFFGTLSNPSPLALDIIHSLGIYGLNDFKIILERILHENIKIIPNFIEGKLSKPEKIYIDIGFEDYQKIKYKREQALGSLNFDGLITPSMGILITSDEDYVPAKIRYNNQEIQVKLRLKGDITDHLKGDKWSYRIKIQDNQALFGMRAFSIQSPGSRGYLRELIYHNALKKEGVLSLRYKFIQVYINGENKGIYALEEHFSKELVEYNNRREGVIVKFDEDLMWQGVMDNADNIHNYTDYLGYMNKNHFDFFLKSEVDSFNPKSVSENPVLLNQFEKSKSLLEHFRDGSLKTSEVFDTDILARYFAINTLIGTSHASFWNNIRFYYNPITSRLEPIGFDAEAFENSEDIINLYSPDCFYGDADCPEIKSFEELFFRDKIFYGKYINELERVSEKSYLDELFSELDNEIKQDTKIIHKDEPSYYFSNDFFYNNQIEIEKKLNPIKGINAYFEEFSVYEKKLVLFIGNNQEFPLEIVNLYYKGSYFEVIGNKNLAPRQFYGMVKYNQIEFRVPFNFVWSNQFIQDIKVNYKISGTENILSENLSSGYFIDEMYLKNELIRQNSKINASELLIINNNSKSIEIKTGSWILNESIVIPEGYSVSVHEGTNIDLTNDAIILSYSDFQFFGSQEKPVVIESSDGTGGFAVFNTKKESNLNYVIFNNLTNPSKEGWELSGAVNFYKSVFNFNGVRISNSNSEDGLNAINSKFDIKDSYFENSFSDCFDSDFSNGTIESSEFNNCGNDAMDFSGSFIDIFNIKITDAGDKGISGGEKSHLNINSVDINGIGKKIPIGIASKDQSELLINNTKISNVGYGLAAYQKKPEFGPGFITAENTIISDSNNKYIVEVGSEISIDKNIILNKETNVYKKLLDEQ